MSHSRFHGWKSRLYSLSHNNSVLMKLTGGILLSGFLIAAFIVQAAGDDIAVKSKWIHSLDHLQERFETVIRSKEGGERALAEWLFDWRYLTKGTKDAAEHFAAMNSTMDGKVKRYVSSKLKGERSQKLFLAFVDVLNDPEEPWGHEARALIKKEAESTPPPAFANEFLGDLLLLDGKAGDAMKAFCKEGAFPDASRARRMAFHLALAMKDQAMLRELLTQPSYKADADAEDLHRAAVMLADWGAAAWGFVRMELQHARASTVIFTLLAGALWYMVFVRFGVYEKWRWIRPLPAVCAGVLSIWPTMILAHWQELNFGLDETGDPMHDLVFYVTGVGLREEASKLLMFSLFLPWLLKQRSPGKALLTGAFVGLGFALDENRGYFHSEGVASAAVARLLTANFFHAAATGITGHALYELARTRFGKAEQFIATFIAIVLVHGVYDWVLGSGSSNRAIGNLSLFSVIILALLARQLFETVEVFIRPKRGMVSLLSMFLVGLSLILAAAFIMAAVQTGTMAAVSFVGQEAIGLVPITVFYARKFAHL